MEYTYKKYQLSEVERLWLPEIYKYDFAPIDIKEIKVKLWGKIPADFKIENIDRRLFINRHITLLGLWYIDAESRYFDYVDKSIITIKDYIKKYMTPKRIKAIEISELCNIPVRNAEIVLLQIYDLGGFFSGAVSSNEGNGYREASFSQEDSAYDEFLRYTSLDDVMEKYFLKHTPLPQNDNTNLNKLLSFYQKSEDKEPEFNAWEEIKKEYHISKKTFGKKINFITDKYKRSIIFRDVEHAYTLAKFGFCKPAAILAGGVIEELLRLYLKQKDIKPQGRGTFEDIIKACQSNSLFQNAIAPLFDSVRYFRNVVHLAREKTKKDAVSMSAAQGVVASIFTIVNDF